MRCFFNLVDSECSIPDTEGIEVADVAELRAEVAEAIEETGHDNPGASRHWTGWRLEVTNPKGAILLTLDLNPSPSA